MTAFDPRTAYAGDWQYMDFVEDAIWERRNETQTPDKITGTKLRPLDMTSRRDQLLAAGLGLTEEQTPWQWWPGNNAIIGMPEKRDIVRQTDKAGWVVQSVQRSPYGDCILATVREVVNVV